MQIEVTAQNIDDYGLAELTGNTKEELLKAASEAARSGQILWFKVPDAASSEHRMNVNVFDKFGQGISVDPADIEHGVAPIEAWDGKEIPEGVDVPMHVCDPPALRGVLETWTCRWCRIQYHWDETSRSWAQIGELEDGD